SLPPARYPLLPYTTRFRSAPDGTQEFGIAQRQKGGQCPLGDEALRPVEIGEHEVQQSCALREAGGERRPFGFRDDDRQQVQVPRSEEHTSELQSRENVVCR